MGDVQPRRGARRRAAADPLPPPKTANDPRDIHTIIRESRKPGVVLQLPPKVYPSSPAAVNVFGDHPSVDDFTIEATGAAGSTVIDCGESGNHCPPTATR